jgi:magnesium transporter
MPNDRIYNQVPGQINIDPSWPFPKINVLAYNASDYVEKFDVEVSELQTIKNQWSVMWVDVVGLGSEATILALKQMFNLHKLALEDVTNLSQRPNIEQFNDTLFAVLQRFSLEPGLAKEQISLFLGKGFVLSFQENDQDCFGTVRKRILNNIGRIRKSKADYLFYAIMDALIDSYFPLFEELGNTLEDLETEIIQTPHESSIEKVYRIRRDLITLRRSVWPQREMLNALLREPDTFISASTQVYLRDCYGNSVQLLDFVENYRELTNSMVDIYMSMISHKMNEVMRLLTIISTIFIPITFIAGIYGMNFNSEISPWNLPELQAYYGYPIVIGIMVLISAVMLYYFYRKGWLGND